MREAFANISWVVTWGLEQAFLPDSFHRMIYGGHTEHSREIYFMLKRLIFDLICFRSRRDSVEDKKDKEENYKLLFLMKLMRRDKVGLERITGFRKCICLFFL